MKMVSATPNLKKKASTSRVLKIFLPMAFWCRLEVVKAEFLEDVAVFPHMECQSGNSPSDPANTCDIGYCQGY